MTTSSNYKKHTESKGLRRRMIDRCNQILLRDLKSENPQSILDAGCGEGFFLDLLFKNNFKNVSGFDSSSEAVEMAKKLTGSNKIFQDEIEKTKSAPTDAVLCLEVLEHLQNPDKALLQIAALSSRLLYITVPKEPYFSLGNLVTGRYVSRLGNHPEHQSQWTSSGFKKFVVNKLGTTFKFENLEPAIFPWTILRGIRT